MSYIIRTDHAFPAQWISGGTNQRIMKLIIDQLESALPTTQRHAFVDTTWLRFAQLPDVAVDNLFLFGFLDPSLKNNINLPVVANRTIEIGYTTSDYGIPLDFWAICANQNFKYYKTQELELTPGKINKFVCYQFKPHFHRQCLVSQLIDADLLDQGVISLGQYNHDPDNPDRSQIYLYKNIKPIIVEADEETASYPGNEDTSGAWQGVHNLYSLGNRDIWQSSFLNIVSETIFASDRTFVSEKIFKPIVGMRPFVINGQPSIYQWLENAGFDTFEDLWPDLDLRHSANFTDHCKKIVEIVRRLSEYSDDDLLSWYKSLRTRLLDNRDRFFAYAIEQEQRAHNMIKHFDSYILTKNNCK